VTHGRCPPSEMLSAYIDGKLDDVRRVAMEEHISRCEECYFVVKESALLRAEFPEPSEAPEARAIEGGGWRGLQRLLPLAATLVVGLGAAALWHRAQGADSYATALRPLVEAVGERRFFAPRLTGGFKYGPVVSSTRAAATGPSSEAWATLARAAEMRQRPEPKALAARGSRAAAALFLGEVDLAVSEYSRLVGEDGANARWASDLSAALLVRAASSRGTEADRAEALRLAEKALSLDPSLSEAQFNRGLALQGLDRKDEARRAFTALVEGGGSWAPAAADALRDLGQHEGPRP
jgi:tetratricopeptide (TPR) repeat protein